jgi:hypothetical protein
VVTVLVYSDHDKGLNGSGLIKGGLIMITFLAPNQVVISTDKGLFLQSYGSIVAFKPHDPMDYHSKCLGEHWDYSATTLKYVKQFMGWDQYSKKDIKGFVKNALVKFNYLLEEEVAQ